MSPAPAAAAAAKAASEHTAQNNAKGESGDVADDDDLIPTDVYERTEESTTTTKSDSGFSFGSGENHEMQIVLMLVLAAVIIFIQHDSTGKPQDGIQYTAIGVVGFALLILAQFAPDIAFAFTILFLVAVILNSPNGVPLLSKAKSASSSSGSAGSPTDTGSSALPPELNTGPFIVPTPANDPSAFKTGPR